GRVRSGGGRRAPAGPAVRAGRRGHRAGAHARSRRRQARDDAHGCPGARRGGGVADVGPRRGGARSHRRRQPPRAPLRALGGAEPLLRDLEPAPRRARAADTAGRGPRLPAGRRGGGVMRVPRATYRLQLGLDLTFDDAAGLVDYLEALGVSDAYTSPFLETATRGSHGYDVAEHNPLREAVRGR